MSHHLFAGNVSYVGTYGPDVPEGILDGAVAIAIELVLGGLHDLCALLDGARDDGIHVIDVEHEADRSAPDCFGAPIPHSGTFVGQHDMAIADLDFSVRNALATWNSPHATATVANQTFRLIGPLKNNLVSVRPVA